MTDDQANNIVVAIMLAAVIIAAALIGGAILVDEALRDGLHSQGRSIYDGLQLIASNMPIKL
jgi:hypothetical protein